MRKFVSIRNIYYLFAILLGMLKLKFYLLFVLDRYLKKLNVELTNFKHVPSVKFQHSVSLFRGN